MNELDIQEIANEYKLDVRPFSNSHFRLLDNFSNYIIDVYIRRKRNGLIVKNTFFLWRTKTWGVLKNKEDLLDKLKYETNK